MKDSRQFGGRISLEFRGGHLEAETAQEDSEQVQLAKRMRTTGEEHVYRLRRPWTPLVTRRQMAWLLLDKSNVMPILQECLELQKKQMLGSRRTPAQVLRQQEAPRNAELPATLDPGSEDYLTQTSRLRYVRNALLVATAKEIVVGRFKYHTDMLGNINALLRPWYNAQWDEAQKTLDERRTRYLERLNQEAMD